MDINEEYREKIMKSIVDVEIQALENNNITTVDVPVINKFVLDRIDNVKTHNELVLFVGELATKWPIFKHIESSEKGEAMRNEEVKVADQVGNLANSGRIEEALGLAKSATDADY